MNKLFISDICNGGVKGHAKYDFVDVDVRHDNLLFIDPVKLELAEDEWSVNASNVVNNYFGAFYSAYANNDRNRILELLSHAHEVNATCLGYGTRVNGKGNTELGLLQKFEPIGHLIKSITTMSKPEDLKVFLPGFAEDGLSDMLTNILHDQLNEFTVREMKKYGMETEKRLSFWTWSCRDGKWIPVTRPSVLVNGKELLLVPKWIVRKQYLVSTDQFFKRIILERMREEGNYYHEDGKPMTKKEIMKLKRFSGEHWLYKETIDYTSENNDALEEYHKQLPLFYEDDIADVDEYLDRILCDTEHAGVTGVAR